jgi:hypothetical protein
LKRELFRGRLLFLQLKECENLSGLGSFGAPFFLPGYFEMLLTNSRRLRYFGRTYEHANNTYNFPFDFSFVEKSVYNQLDDNSQPNAACLLLIVFE